jgi:hypothetical protein
MGPTTGRRRCTRSQASYDQFATGLRYVAFGSSLRTFKGGCGLKPVGACHSSPAPESRWHMGP